MPTGTREGPRTELRVMCGGCKYLSTRKDYGSNDYEEIDYVCEHPKPIAEIEERKPLDNGKKRDCVYLPMRGETPNWCPFYPIGATIMLPGPAATDPS